MNRSRIRVLMVNSTLHIGGAEKVAADLAIGVDRSAFELTACYLKESGVVAERMRRSDVTVVGIPGLQIGRTDYLSSLKLRRLVRQERVQVIHTHDLHGLVDGAICRMLTPGLTHVHTFHFGNYPNIPSRYRRLEALLWRIPDALIAVGNAQAAALRDLYKIPPERLQVVWNGVEDVSSCGLPPLVVDQSPAGAPVIASISTLITQKGLEYLLQAAALLRASGDRFVLLVAGDGHLRPALERQAYDLQIADCVRFLGWVPEAAGRVLPVCDIFVQSSLWEAMSVVVLEAMAAGKPLVASSVGENRYVVVHEASGLLVPPGDPSSLADALRRLLRDPELRARLGRAARSSYEERFRANAMIQAYEAIYASLVKRKLS